jgi:hypothetical protein
MVAISQSVGAGGKNQPSDVAVVDNLLRKVGVLRHPAPTPNVRIEAIKSFQDIWGIGKRPGRYGLVTPGGPTLTKLDHTASPLKLKPITKAKVSRGGYSVSFEPERFPAQYKIPPAPYKLFLGVAAAKRGNTLAWELCIDISDRNRNDVFTPENLPDLLKLISALDAWAPKQLRLQLFLVKDGLIVSESNIEILKCPVRPHKGALLPMENDTPPKIKYVFKPGDKVYHGRWLHEVSGVEEKFFTEKGFFEDNPDFRGFGCIGYVSLVCGMPFEHLAEAKAADGAEAYSGEDLAQYVNASRCNFGEVALEKTNLWNVIKFFKTNPPGYYLVWSGTHIMIANDGYIHEFNDWNELDVHGYGQTPIERRLLLYKGKNKEITVRRLVDKPVRAK